MISVYILGHILGKLTEPVIYVRRHYLDYDDQVIGSNDPFIGSLTHDSIIVQIPFLKGRTRTRLERLLNLFDQDYKKVDNEHYLEVDESMYTDEHLIVYRLVKAAASPEVRRAMEVEDEMLSEIEARDTRLMQQEEQLIHQEEQLQNQGEQLLHQRKQLTQKQEMLLQKQEMLIRQEEQLTKQEEVIEQRTQQLIATVRMLLSAGFSGQEISERLSIDEISIKKMIVFG